MFGHDAELLTEGETVVLMYYKQNITVGNINSSYVLFGVLRSMDINMMAIDDNPCEVS